MDDNLAASFSVPSKIDRERKFGIAKPVKDVRKRNDHINRMERIDISLMLLSLPKNEYNHHKFGFYVDLFDFFCVQLGNNYQCSKQNAME